MENFNFYAPTYFEFGKDSENEVGNLIKRFNGHKVLIHYGKESVKKTGLLDRIKKSLENSNIDYVELGGVCPNPRSGLVYEGIELCQKEGVDFILAVGGGSCIDSSKAIAVGTLYDGDFWDFFEGEPIKEALPVGTVLTISAAGSEGSPDAVITKEEGMFKRGIGSNHIRPKFSILNPALTQTLPIYQVACGITDIMAHLYERYLTKTKNVEVTDRLIESLLLTMISEGKKAVNDPTDYEARANIMWAGMIAHNNCCGVGRSQDWSSHCIEHELSAEYDCAHGAGLAVVMPAVFNYILSYDVNRFAKVAVRVWNVEMDFDNPINTAKAGIESFRNFLISIGMPKNFKELGAKKEDIKKMANRCCYGDGRDGKIGGAVTLSQDDVEKIYEMMDFE